MTTEGFTGKINIRPISSGNILKIIFQHGKKETFKNNIDNVMLSSMIYLDDTDELFYRNEEGQFYKLNFEKYDDFK